MPCLASSYEISMCKSTFKIYVRKSTIILPAAIAAKEPRCLFPVEGSTKRKQI